MQPGPGLSKCFLPSHLTPQNPLSIQRVQKWTKTRRIDSRCNYPRGRNEEQTQLGSDEWKTEWKYHGSKSIHRHQNFILNQNGSGNISKQSEKLTQGLAKLTTDKLQVSVQLWQASRWKNIRYVSFKQLEYSIEPFPVIFMFADVFTAALHKAFGWVASTDNNCSILQTCLIKKFIKNFMPLLSVRTTFFINKKNRKLIFQTQVKLPLSKNCYQLWGWVRATRLLHDEVPGIWFTSWPLFFLIFLQLLLSLLLLY